MKLITTLSLLLIGALTYAQSTSMTIFNNSGQSFFVIMNGIRQNSIPQTNVKIGGMSTGSYEVKLIFADGKTGDINKKLYLDTPGDYLTRVVIKGKKRKLQWFGIPDETQTLPAGGTAIEYRPSDQSIYSDQQQVSGTLNGQSGTVQPSQTYQTQPVGTVQPANTQSGTITSPITTSGTVQSGTTATSTTTTNIDPATGLPVPNQPAVSGSGQNSGAGTITSNTTGQQSTTFGSSTTIPDPNIPTGFGVHINVNEPNPAAGGTFGMTTTVIDPVTGETIHVNHTAQDPGMNGNGNFGMSTTVTGTGLGGTTTSSSTTSTTSSSTTTQNGQVVNDTFNQSTSVTQNGQTTTTTQSSQYGNQNGNTTGNGQYGTTTNGQQGTTYNSGTTTTQPVVSGTNYSCTKVLIEGDAFITRLKAETFEADKLEMIETDLKDYCVTSDQAYRIINSLTFDGDKLEMSKFLYVRMSDKANGKRLLELFTYDTDKKDFTAFMAKH